GPEAGESAAELCGRSEIAFLVGAAQRLKQYVTEGQSLRSIRGAASILDRVTAKLAEEVADGVGRECVLRDAGSVLECVVPADQAPWWKDRIRSVFFSETDAVFAATGYVRCTVGHLLSDEFGDARQRAWRLVESDRDGAEWPGMETLPFEARCLRCGVRSAEIDSGNPPGSGDRRSQILCGACRVRETEGSRIRRERVIKAIEIGLGRGGTGPRDLGVTHDFPDALPPSLDEMVPRFSDVRDKVGVITFDGDNFGQLVRSLRDYASSVQWSRRTRNTVRVAAYRALCEAVQSAADRRPGLFDYLPFEVLLLSGDEFTAITWEGIALDTAKCFLEYADREYSAVKHDIHFSGAVTTCSKKAPARLLLESCEALLKVAKRHAKQREEGVVNFLVTDSLAELPDDPAELAEMLFKDPETKGGEPLCLTLLPLSARELGFMLERAREVVRKNQVGPLKRLAGAYLRRPSAVAKLFFLYYMARAKDAGLQDMVGAKARLAWTDVFPEICLPDSTVPGRLPLTIDGHLRGDHPTQVRFTPLRDLVEIAKTLPRTGG
ncbi:MAG TPA: hypothetical protein GX513_03870, partial [Firmicutes bacterium]|nr:hypothetical protein [Bacillota bacterium]